MKSVPSVPPSCLTESTRHQQWNSGWSRLRRNLAATVLVVAMIWCIPLRAATLPTGFTEQQIGGTWNDVVGVLFDDNGRGYVWERGGRVWLFENGQKSTQPLIDISDEVGGWRDFGLLGFALDPNFLQNGYIYLLYVVDHHHLAQFGSPGYSPATDEYFQATIGRITRYTARAADGFSSVDLNSRRILLGETASTGFPILHQSHGVGSLLFGTDGTLLASCGDGASYSSTDLGSASETYYAQALTEGIIRPEENVGAYRSQMVDSHNGKILRMDPATGDGIPSNPFYDGSAPRAPRSRVWALGLRNPCRITLRPGTGSHDPNDADPGVIYIGDVGWNTWEDLHTSTGPGQNFGWPAFEGMEAVGSYYNANVMNLDAPMPPAQAADCGRTHYYFRELIKQETTNPLTFVNECTPSAQIPASIPTFMHSRPSIDWRHGSGPSRTGTFDGSGLATVSNVGAAGSPVSGPQFGGNCSIGGVWYLGTDFPASYQNSYFHADYGGQWIRNFVFDQNDKPVAVNDFLTGGGGVVAMATHPTDGNLYYVAWNNTLRKITFVPSGNQPPTAVASADTTFGPATLNVQFTGDASSDPEGLPLAYDWNFGDGSPNSSQVNPAHAFNAPPAQPTPYTVTLTVTDSGGLTSQSSLLISVNNTPPTASIISPPAGTLYPLTGDTVYNLTANVIDNEFPDEQLTYAWTTFLHHNNHEHAEPVDNNHETTTVISPIGCGSETYYYRIELTVTDPAGLSATTDVELWPDCPNRAPIASFSANPVSGQPPLLVQFNASASTDPDGDPLNYDWDFGDGNIGTGLAPSHTYNSLGAYTVTLTVTDPESLFDTESTVVSALPPGVEGTYYDNIDLTNPVLTRFDPVIDFDWGTGSPDPSIGADTFSVRWVGQVEPLFSEVYTFYAVTDDGFRLWVNGQLVIDSWIDQSPTERSGTIALTAGVRADFTVEYYENGGGAVARLLWSSPTQIKEVIPAIQLFPPPPPNTPPSISSIEDQTIDEDTSTGILAFTVGDAESNPDDLVVTVTPDDPVFVPEHHITLGGSGANRTLELQAEENASGATLIHVQVSDGIASSVSTFLLTVNAVNDAPTISAISDLNTLEDVSAGPIAFLIDDLETPPNGLIVTGLSSDQNLLPDGNIVFGGTGVDRTVTLTPAANQSGAVLVSITVNDGLASASETFQLTVDPVNDPPLLLWPSGGLSYTAGDGVVLLDAGAEASDVDSPDLDAGALTISFIAQGQLEDRLGIRHEGDGPGQVGVTGSEVRVGGVAVGTLVGGTDGTVPLQILLNASATPSSAQLILRNATYENVSATPSTQARTLQAVLDDGDGGISAAVVMTVSLIGVPVDPDITWDTPSPITYGTPLGMAELDASASVPGSFTYSPDAGTVLNAGGGQTLSVTFTPDDSLNYNVVQASVLLDVVPANLTIQADNKSKPYGAILPTLTASYGGLVNGDTPADLDTPASLTTTAVTGSDVGDYPIVVQNAADSNYSITFANGTLSVTPATLTITAEDKVKLYGAAVPTLTAVYSGFVNGDGPANLDIPASLTTTATSASDAGDYPISVQNAADSNYSIVLVDGTLSVTPAALMITAEDKAKLYGAAIPALTAVYSGFVNGDDPASLDTPVSLTTTATSGSDVGNYPIVAQDAADANYAISFVNGTLNITPVSLTITADDASRAEGDQNPVFTATYVGLVSGDTPADLDSPVQLTTTADENSPEGTYPITAQGAADLNYLITHQNGTLTVTPAAAFTSARINFQPAASALPAGYVADTGSVYGTRTGGLSFGWDADNSSTASDAGFKKSPDPRYDTNQRMQESGAGSVWELNVPNGTYDVLIVAGDAKDFSHNDYRIDVEGVLMVDGVPDSRQRWISGSARVSVADRRLSVTSAPGASDNRICFIDVDLVSLSGGVVPARAGGGAEARLSSPRILDSSEGRMVIPVSGESGRRYTIEASEDLDEWRQIATAEVVDGAITFADPEGRSASRRFYRVLVSR